MPSDLLSIAMDAAQAGGEVLARQFRRGGVEAEEKARNDLVTAADRASEARILAVLAARRPGDAVLAEESGWSGDPANDRQWIVDPLDGTANFAHGLPMFSVSVACRQGGDVVAGVVLDPIGGHLFAAERGAGATWNGRPIRIAPTPGLDSAFLATGFPFRARGALDLYLQSFRRLFLRAGGIRRCGSAALDLAFTAAGVYAGFFELQLSAWDIAAGEVLIREAGGVVTDLDGGERHLETGNVLAGAPGVHADMLAELGGLASEAMVRSLTEEAEAVEIL